jgi:hypothetical protein
MKKSHWSKIAAATSLLGTIALAFALRTSPGDVRLVAKGDAFYFCRNDGQHIGFRVGGVATFGSGCPEAGGEPAAVVRAFRPGLEYAGWGFLGAGAI